MGNDAAAATAAGAIAVQYVFKRNLSPPGFRSPSNVLVVFVVVDSEPIRRATPYTRANAAKDRKAIVRALFVRERFE